MSQTFQHFTYIHLFKLKCFFSLINYFHLACLFSLFLSLDWFFQIRIANKLEKWETECKMPEKYLQFSIYFRFDWIEGIESIESTNLKLYTCIFGILDSTIAYKKMATDIRIIFNWWMKKNGRNRMQSFGTIIAMHYHCWQRNHCAENEWPI